jgi:hypothetical protein
MSPLSIVFTVVVLVLVFMILRYLVHDPNTLQSLQDGKTLSTITASSLATNDASVASSNFAYSVWFYVNDWNYRYGEPKVVFGRMGSPSGSSQGSDSGSQGSGSGSQGSGSQGSGSIPGISGLDPCPAVVLGAIENNIMIALGCYPGIDDEPSTPGGKTVIHKCSISNIPIQRWVNLIISVYGRTMDIYIDGKLVKTNLLPGVASVNNNADIYVTPKGGFDGWTSKLQYYPNSLNPQDAWNIYVKGYGGSFLSNLLGSYDVQVSLQQNGTTTNSYTF